MSQTTKQKAFQLFIFAILIGLCMPRPNGNAESQETTDNQPNLSDLEKVYAFYKPLQYYTYYDEPNMSDRTQFQFRSSYPSSPFRSSGGGGGNAAGLSMWDSNRQLMSKRQARYRQCYFNPISCFRK